MFPEGYELAFLVWADYLMASGLWNAPFNKWGKEAFKWMNEIEELARGLKFRNYKRLITVSLIERLLDTILADIIASDRPGDEKKRGYGLMIKMIKILL